MAVVPRKDAAEALVRHLRDVLVDVLSFLEDPEARGEALSEMGVGGGGASGGRAAADDALSRLDASLASQESLVATLELLRALITAVEDMAGSPDPALGAEAFVVGVLNLFSSSAFRFRLPLVWAIASTLGFIDGAGLRFDNLAAFVEDARSYLSGRVAAQRPEETADLASVLMGGIGTALLFIPRSWTGDHVEVRMLYGWDPGPGSPHPIADAALERTLTVGVRSRPVDPKPGDAATAGGEVLLSSIIVPTAYGGPGIFLALGGSLSIAIPLGTHGTQLKLDVAVQDAATLAIFTDGRAPVFNALSGTEGSVALAIERPESVDGSWSWPGEEGIHLEVGKFALQAKLGTSSTGVLFKTKDTSFVVPRDAFGDGFMKTILPSSGLRVDADFGLGYDTRRGFYIDGGAKLEAVIPINRTTAWGVLDVHEITLALQASSQNGEGRFSLGAGAAFTVNIAVVSLTVDGLGLQAVLANKRDQAGKLGPLDFSVDVQWPRGVGVVVDAKVVKGGGYLYFDPDKGRYGGALELQFATFGLKAIGLLTTKLPDGRPGFSLIVIISVDFNPPIGIELGFGIKLFSVGGLFGLNHGVDADKLQDGLHTHALDDILFPADPVADAPRILTTLGTVFPVLRDNYLLGLMMKVGWGTSRLVVLTVGIVVSFPASNRVILLGQVTVTAPDPLLPIVMLKADVLGILNLDEPSFSLFVSIDPASRLSAFTISGDMALMVRGGHSGFFLVSAGGFNERFQPPALPATRLKRLAVDISGSPNPRLRLEAYLAVTSNTFQVGARLQLSASAGPFAVDGYLQFDAFFQWEPSFHFSTRLRGGLALRFEGDTLLGIQFDLLLEGPDPWHFRGTATITLLFFDIPVHLEATWGDSAPALGAQQFDLLAKVSQAVGDGSSWAGEQPAADAQLVTLRSIEESAVPIHPLGTLTLRQRAAPLGVRIDKIGTSRPAANTARRVDVANVTFGGGGAQGQASDLPDAFAPGEYLDLSEDQKLSRPSFEPFKSGLRLSGPNRVHGPFVETDVAYRTILLGQQPRTGRPHAVPWDVARLAARSGAVARSQVASANAYAAPGKPVTIAADHQTVVASSTDLTARPLAELAAAATYTLAHQALERHLQSHPEERGRLQLVGAHEAR